jgi:uncharacterized protein (DUF983 family)
MDTIFCVRCRRPVSAVRHGARHGLHFLLTLVTGVWLFAWIYQALGRPRLSCRQCGLDITPMETEGDRPLFRVLVASLVGVCLFAFALHFLT